MGASPFDIARISAVHRQGAMCECEPARVITIVEGGQRTTTPLRWIDRVQVEEFVRHQNPPIACLYATSSARYVIE